jgi:tRNA nucleotidyltransferase (CCA-adding enzyme)
MIIEAPEFQKAIPIIEAIERAGYEAYFVGGSVRDTLLHLDISDVDIASSAMPEEIQRIFPITFDVGIQHGTVMVLFEHETYEITTFRTESKYEKFRRPEKVQYVRSLQDDLKRRDFTINAIAIDRHGNIKDFFNGQADLANKLIRAVGNPEERFREDALRMMRAARFVSQLDFEIEQATKEAIIEYHPLLSKIAVERVREEWNKLLIGRNRKGGVKFFVETRLFQMCPGFQNREDALIDLALFPLQFKGTTIAWTVLVHFLDLKDEAIDPFLRQWKCSRKEIMDIRIGAQALNKRLQQFWDYPLLFETGIEIAMQIEEIIEGFGLPNQSENLIELNESMPIHTLKDLALDGKELLSLLGIKRGGPFVGEIFEELKTLVLANKLENSAIAIKDFIKKRRMIYLDETFEAHYVVASKDLASEIGSGTLPVLGTPALLAMIENACMGVVKAHLSEGDTTVGIHCDIHHKKASRVGADISVTVRVTEHRGNKYFFECSAHSGGQEIATAKHTRAIVAAEEFMGKA